MHAGGGAARRVAQYALDLGVREQGDVLVAQRRADTTHVCVGLAVGEAGEAVEAVAAHAAPGLGVALVEVDAHRQVKRTVAGALEVVGELLDPGLVHTAGYGNGPDAGGSVGSSPRLAVHEVQALGLA